MGPIADNVDGSVPPLNGAYSLPTHIILALALAMLLLKSMGCFPETKLIPVANSVFLS